MSLSPHPTRPTVFPKTTPVWRQPSALALPQDRLILFPDSQSGFVQLPFQKNVNVYTQLSHAHLPWPELSFKTVYVHLAIGCPEQIKQEVLSEVSRVAWKHIWVLAPTVPADPQGCFEMHACFQVKTGQPQWTKEIYPPLILSCFETNL